MKKRLPLFITILCLATVLTNGQNLLDTNSWTVGSGSVSGFSQNGLTSKNSREYGTGPHGNSVLLWKATPDANNDLDGGWNSDYQNINHTKTYRFSVWLKKTNSNEGNSYFGCIGKDNILNLDGTVNNNPYFWYGDLPKLNRWYLVIGYVHRSDYSSTENLGRIYDGVTGEEVKTITDFKLKNTAVRVLHRSYLYYDKNTSDRQYFYAPRIDAINGKELTINGLLNIHKNAQLNFSYDNSNNQKQVYYCSDSQKCTAPKKLKARSAKAILAEETLIDKKLKQDINNTNFSTQLLIYPNPTRGWVTFKIKSELLTKVVSIQIYNTNSSLLQNVTFNTKNAALVDLSTKPYGVYFVRIQLNNGQIITKQIIKN